MRRLELKQRYCDNPNCKKPLSHDRMVSKGKFCDAKCYGNYLSIYNQREKNPRWNTITVECTWCNGNIERNKSHLSKRNFCCRDCYSRWMAKHQVGKNSIRGGVKFTEEHRKRLSEAHIGIQAGPRHPNWRGGTASEPYCIVWSDKTFKEYIRERDNYHCLNPGCWGTSTRLNIHHIDYDKKNCKPSNLITLCISCNARANHNREYHNKLFQKAINGRYGYRFPNC